MGSQIQQKVGNAATSERLIINDRGYDTSPQTALPGKDEWFVWPPILTACTHVVSTLSKIRRSKCAFAHAELCIEMMRAVM